MKRGYKLSFIRVHGNSNCIYITENFNTARRKKFMKIALIVQKLPSQSGGPLKSVYFLFNYSSSTGVFELYKSRKM